MRIRRRFNGCTFDERIVKSIRHTVNLTARFVFHTIAGSALTDILLPFLKDTSWRHNLASRMTLFSQTVRKV